ncbi:MAG: hypothetical protein ABUS54_08770 [Actinomycetota bacterium]
MGRVATYVVAGVVVLAVAVVGVVVWLRTYAPLAAAAPVTPGPSVASQPGPVFGGRTVQVTFMLRNGGRFSVTVLGAQSPADVVRPAALALRPHDSALVTVRWRLRCGLPQLGSVRLRYRYLSRFTRTEAVALPFAVTPHC